MKTNIFYSLLLIIGILPDNINGATRQREHTPPNVIIILADDLGWGDLGCYGNPIIKTPNLDRLAESGIKFTQFHSAGAICSPSRAALLAGKSPYRLGFFDLENEFIHLKREELTIPELLKQKQWHINNHHFQW